eukprot:SAG31_NODE_27926_length_418_cov_0.796238_1_plen_21_part_01
MRSAVATLGRPCAFAPASRAL